MTDVVVNFAVGASCSGLVNLLTEPADRARAGYRGQDYDPKVVSGETRRASNVAQWMQQSLRRDGARVFLPNLRRAAQRSYLVSDGLKLSFKDAIARYSFRARHARSEWKQFCAINCFAGGVAGYLAHVVMYPFSQAAPSFDVLRTDPLSLYKGFWPSVAPVVVYSTVFFGIFDTMNGRNPYEVYKFRRTDAEKNIFGWKVVSGQVAGIAAVLLSRPYFVAAHRLVNRNPYEFTGMNRKYYNIHHTMVRIMAEEGMSSLFRGLVFYPSMLSGVVVVLYDVGKKAFSPPPVLEDDYVLVRALPR